MADAPAPVVDKVFQPQQPPLATSTQASSGDAPKEADARIDMPAQPKPVPQAEAPLPPPPAASFEAAAPAPAPAQTNPFARSNGAGESAEPVAAPPAMAEHKSTLADVLKPSPPAPAPAPSTSLQDEAMKESASAEKPLPSLPAAAVPPPVFAAANGDLLSKDTPPVAKDVEMTDAPAPAPVTSSAPAPAPVPAPSMNPVEALSVPLAGEKRKAEEIAPEAESPAAANGEVAPAQADKPAPAAAEEPAAKKLKTDGEAIPLPAAPKPAAAEAVSASSETSKSEPVKAGGGGTKAKTGFGAKVKEAAHNVSAKVKEAVSNAKSNGDGLKKGNSRAKKEKKPILPVGRTARKTRSQGPAEA